MNALDDIMNECAAEAKKKPEFEAGEVQEAGVTQLVEPDALGEVKVIAHHANEGQPAKAGGFVGSGLADVEALLRERIEEKQRLADDELIHGSVIDDDGLAKLKAEVQKVAAEAKAQRLAEYDPGGMTPEEIPLRKAGIIEINLELLAEVLRLPEGMQIRGIIPSGWSFLRPVAEIVIEGEHMPEVPEGEKLPEVFFEYTLDDETFDQWTRNGRRPLTTVKLTRLWCWDRKHEVFFD